MSASKPILSYYFTPEALRAGIGAPSKAYKNDAGFDLRALRPYLLRPQSVTQVHTGVGFEIPEGFYGLICNRTSGGLKGILPIGHVVDAGYTDEIILLLYNTDPSRPIAIKANERIAQMVVMPTYQGELRQIQAVQIKRTERGPKRLGSSGSM